MPRAAPARPRARRRRGRPLRLPRNAVYDAIHAAGGPTYVARELGVSSATMARWRRENRVHTAADVLQLVALVGAGPTMQLQMARILAGLVDGPARNGPRPPRGK